MSKKVLALDLGPTSIGWALVEEAKQTIIATGVCVFPEGVKRDASGAESPKGQERRVARGMRRQVARRARRKIRLREALVTIGLLPAIAGRPSTDIERRQWEAEVFTKADPYTLRSKALNDKLELHELGRVFLHLAQHRGFLSNRKADRARKKETTDMEKEMSALAGEINAGGHRTLGEHFAAVQQADPTVRVRGRHTRRNMLLEEFDAIWQTQSKFHAKLLTDELKYGHGKVATPYPCEPVPLTKSSFTPLQRFGIHGLIFFQRALYWPKSMIGRCEIDPKQKRCPRADRAAQEFRMLQEVNNLCVIHSDGEYCPLTGQQRNDLIALLSRKEEAKWEEIRKELKLPDGTGFNLQAGDRKKLQGTVTDYKMSRPKALGKQWAKRTDEEKNAVVRALIVCTESQFLERAAELGLDVETAGQLLDVHLPEGYSNYGQETIEKLLPHLRAGLQLTAQEGKDSALRNAGFLAPWERPRKPGESLLLPPKITNPIVRQAMFTVRRLVNAIVKEYGKPDTVHIELAREVKGNAEQRDFASRRMREREARRDEAADAIREHGDKPTRDKIERYLLWQEQREQCIYSGRSIGLTQLLGGEADVDHILPYSKSLDNSFMNKVVCFRDENGSKGQQTVHQWLAATQPEKYDGVLQRAGRLPDDVRNAKLTKISRPTCEIEDFLNRHLTDTAYLTRVVHEYLKCLTPDVIATKGQFTAELRHQWGLNEVLRDDGLDLKNRDDHRHHAVDAIIIAFTDRSRLQLLARHRGQSPLPAPWDSFRADVENAVNAINVWHRPRLRICGALHDDTLYGATQKQADGNKTDRPWAKDWLEEPGEYVLRKSLEALSLGEVERIRDVRIREVVQERLAKFNLSAGRQKKGAAKEGGGNKIPKDVWKEPLYLTPRNGKGSRTLIKRVRLTKPEDSVVPLRDGGRTCVKPGNSHHVAIFELTNGKGKTRRVAHFVSMLEAAKRKSKGQSVIQRTHPEHPEARLIMALHNGDMVCAEFKGKLQLLRLSSAVSTSEQLRFYSHTDAISDPKHMFRKSAAVFVGKKVLVDLLGRVHPAH